VVFPLILREGFPRQIIVSFPLSPALLFLFFPPAFFIIKTLLLESNFFKVNFRKVNYFLIFGSVIKNKLKNIFQYLVMS
jgi:hypothetical protein